MLLGIVLAASLAFAQTAWSQNRNFPPATKRAQMQPPQGNLIRLDSEDLVLSAAAQIRDRHNRIVVPAMVHEPATVRYQLDTLGNVWRVWILTEQEAAQADE